LHAAVLKIIARFRHSSIVFAKRHVAVVSTAIIIFRNTQETLSQMLKNIGKPRFRLQRTVFSYFVGLP